MINTEFQLRNYHEDIRECVYALNGLNRLLSESEGNTCPYLPYLVQTIIEKFEHAECVYKGM